MCQASASQHLIKHQEVRGEEAQFTVGNRICGGNGICRHCAWQQVPQQQQRRRLQHRAAATAEAAVVAAAAAGLADINDLSLPRAMSHNELLWPYDANSPTVTYQML